MSRSARAQQGCPEVAYPVGVDEGAARVSAVLSVGDDGRVVAAEAWKGPEALITAVQVTLPRCRLPGPGVVPHSWEFSRPPVNVAGQVRSAGDRAPIVALVVVVGDRVATTDEAGRFELRNVAPGAADVRIHDPRFRLPETTVEVSTRERVDLELWVIRETGRDDEIVGRYSREEPTGVVRTVGLDEARGMPGTLGDPLRVLAGQPGLSRTPYDAGWLLVRGGEFDESGMYLDGVRVPLIYHLGGFTSVLHPEMVDAVRFWPGLYPARYGNALSGVVDMVPRPVGERTRAVGGMNLVFAHAFVETPAPWGGIAVAARRSYLDGILSVVLDPAAAGIAPRFWDVQARASIGDASVTMLGLSDAIDAPSFSGDGILEILQRAAQIQAVVPLGDAVEVRPWIAWTSRDVTGDVTPQAVAEWYPGLRIEAKTDRTSPVRVHGGVEAQRRSFRLLRGEELRTAPITTVDPYVGLRMGDPLAAWTELRLETVWVPEQPFRWALSPRSGVRWDVTRWLELHGAYGRLHQLPPPTLLLALAEGVYLDLEESEQLAAGFGVGDSRARLLLDVFTRDARKLGELELDGSVGQGLGRARGFESTLEVRRNLFDGTVVYQYTRSQKQEDARSALRPSPYEQPHRLEVRLAQGLPRNWTIAGRFRYTSGFPRTLDEGVLQPAEAYDILLQRTVELNLAPTERRLAPYHALDLRVARTFTFRKWRLEASLDVQNVYNRRVVEPVITGFGESRPSYGFGLPVLPIFALDGEFFPGKPPE